ncbi:MAG: HD domain-containing protein [Syntrophales bacterium]|nr:HD domain-containing protein [Syntrophales bacterium]MDY0045659.1 HD domain-containing protein [Syntrophales bacterium]
MNFNVPVKKNAKLITLLEHINRDSELLQLWKCANVNAVDRGGISDHGEIHIRIVSNAALRILRLLVKGNISPSVVTNYNMDPEDAEVIVILASCLHDIGISVHRHDHERYSLLLAYPKARQLLAGIYQDPELTIITSEVLHAIVSHNTRENCLTIESGILKVADALDMAEGRSRIPFEAGNINIHSLSARAVESVNIEEGEKQPVRIVIKLANSAGIFQIDELLTKKLQNSSIRNYVEIIAKIEGETERKLIEIYRF